MLYTHTHIHTEPYLTPGNCIEFQTVLMGNFF